MPETSSVSAQAEGRSLEHLWDRIIRGIIYALTFVLPLLFTSWTFEPLEFSKQMLLFILTTAALVAWLLKLLVFRSWRMVKTPLDLPIGIFVFVYFLASLFSVDRVASFLGFFGSFSGNFFQVLFLAAFYYLVVNHFSTFDQVKRLVSVFFLSIFLALVFVIFQFFGLHLFPFAFAKVKTFTTVGGGLLTLTVFSALAIVLSQAFRGAQVSLGRTPVSVWRAVLVISTVIAFVVLLTVNFVYAWVTLLAGLLLNLVFQVALSKNLSLKNIVAPLVLVIIAVSFVVIQFVFPFVSIRNLLRFDLPQEVRLDYQTAAPVLKSIATQKPILGSGPNTFLYAFSKYREEKFNVTPFWNVRFDKAPSEAAEYFSGTGILGFLAFEILAGLFLFYGAFLLLRKRDGESWGLALGVFSAFAVLWVAHWFFFFNTVLAFSFWLMLGSFMALSRSLGGEKVTTMNFSFASSPRQTVSVVSAVSLSLVLVIVFVFFASAVYASDIFYRRGLSSGTNPEQYDSAQADFEQAIRLNRYRPDYYLTYGEFLFQRINQELTKSQPNTGAIQTWLAASINTSRAAVDLSPSNWTAWERLANLYTFARPLVAGVDKFILESLTRATESDTKNPILFTELGQAYRLAAKRLDPAILGTGADTDADGLSDQQEEVVGSDPSDPDSNANNVLDGTEVLNGLNPAGSGPLSSSFLSRYIKTDAESLLKAQEAFRKAIALKDDYAAAYYQLAVTLEQAGKYDEAVEVMEQVLRRYPGNADLKFELGRMYYNSGRADLATRQFQELAAVYPNNSNILFSLAVSYERLGNTKKALEIYSRVYAINPDNQVLKEKVQQLERLVK